MCCVQRGILENRACLLFAKGARRDASKWLTAVTPGLCGMDNRSVGPAPFSKHVAGGEVPLDEHVRPRPVSHEGCGQFRAPPVTIVLIPPSFPTGGCKSFSSSSQTNAKQALAQTLRSNSPNSPSTVRTLSPHVHV